MNTNKKNKVKKVKIIYDNNKVISLKRSPSFNPKILKKSSSSNLINPIIPNTSSNKKMNINEPNLKKFSMTNYRNKSQKNLFYNIDGKNSRNLKRTHMNMTVLPPISEDFPFSLRKGYKKKKNDSNLNCFEKMKKYKIVFKKKTKKDEIRKEDKLFKLLRENGLHYSLSSNKYVLDENDANFIAHKIKYKNRCFIPDKESKESKESNDSTERKKEKEPTNIISRKHGSPYVYFYSTTEEDDEDKMTYEKYIKMQTLAEMKFKPKYGDQSNDLINYIKKIETIRKGVVNDIVNDIKNIENRYNEERPKEDSNIDTKEQRLIHHKWKNLFSLQDYQELFINNLKGKISDKNYNLMMKKFKEISIICFADKNQDFNKLKAKI